MTPQAPRQVLPPESLGIEFRALEWISTYFLCLLDRYRGGLWSVCTTGRLGKVAAAHQPESRPAGGPAGGPAQPSFAQVEKERRQSDAWSAVSAGSFPALAQPGSAAHCSISPRPRVLAMVSSADAQQRSAPTPAASGTCWMGTAGQLRSSCRADPAAKGLRRRRALEGSGSAIWFSR